MFQHSRDTPLMPREDKTSAAQVAISAEQEKGSFSLKGQFRTISSFWTTLANFQRLTPYQKMSFFRFPTILTFRGSITQLAHSPCYGLRPRRASIFLPLTAMLMLASTFRRVSSTSSTHFRGSFPSTCLPVAVLRIKPDVTSKPPRTCYPAVGQPSGTGISPARLCDLSRPQCESWVINLMHQCVTGF